MLELLSDPNVWLAFLTLTALEIVLGIDNVVFISILADKLPPSQRKKARQLGLAAALITRILLLASIAWIVKLTVPLFTMPFIGHGVTGKDLVLLLGGLFLIGKSVHEVHGSLEGEHDAGGKKAAAHAFWGVIIQIMILDIVFSLDSVITAVGLADDLPVMIAAVIVAVLIMLIASGPISSFVSKHPTVKMLALSFLILIGTMLIADAFGYHIPKGYIYFAMAFSLGVEMLNLRLRSKSEKPVELHKPYAEE